MSVIYFIPKSQCIFLLDGIGKISIRCELSSQRRCKKQSNHTEFLFFIPLDFTLRVLVQAHVWIQRGIEGPEPPGKSKVGWVSIENRILGKV